MLRRCWIVLVGCVAFWLAHCGMLRAEKLELPEPKPTDPIRIQADRAARWSLDKATEAWLLSGNCQFRQGEVVAKSDSAVLFVDKRFGETLRQAAIYLEGNVEMGWRQGVERARLTDHSWYGVWQSLHALEVRTPPPEGVPAEKPLVYQNAMMRRNAFRQGVVRRAQFTRPPGQTAPGASATGSEPRNPGEIPLPAPRQPNVPGQAAAEVPPAPPGERRLQAWPRSSAPVQASWFRDEQRNEWVATIDSGINLLITGLDEFGTVDIATDRLVIWTQGEEADLSGQTTLRGDRPLEIYMEGNVVFRQGERVLYCERMYYDVRREIGTIVQAEVITPVRNYSGLVRLRADVVRQTARDRFLAENAYVTTSQMGRPGYRLQAETIYFEDQQVLARDPLTGEPAIDPLTGEPLVEHDRVATSVNNFFFIERVPAFYWPYFSANLERPEFYIRKASYRHDDIFGDQFLTDWDLYQIFGIDHPPAGTDWTLSLDYLTERGLGHGTRFGYSRSDSLLGVPSAYAGVVDYWGILDNGLDNLGGGRSGLLPESDYRYRLFGRHRMSLPNEAQLTLELGAISDRNFLEQYFEQEWDTFKDLTTGAQLRQSFGNMSWDVAADFRVNEFFTDTSAVKANHFWIGQPLLGDYLTYFERTEVGFVDQGVATMPLAVADAANFTLRPWEVERRGARLITTHELNLPLQAGPVKVVPYVAGQAAHWSEDIAGEHLERVWGKIGTRATLSMWSLNPEVESELLNLHGLAHKVVFEVDGSFADSSENATDLPLYDPLDDNAQEHFRRRFTTNTFGGAIPDQFDERLFAIRSGLSNDVSSPAAELADDLFRIRGGVHQRWQTQRGLPGQRHITDVVILDAGVSFFPNDERDNFDEPFGLLDYDFIWNIGDRTRITSQGVFDFFAMGQQIVRVGVELDRPERGNLYLGFRSLQGPFDNQVALLSYKYRLSHKWYSTFSTAYDFAEERNTGQRFTISRIGESFVVSFGFNIDANKDNFGIGFSITPRFLPGARLGTVGGVPAVGPAGLNGLE